MRIGIDISLKSQGGGPRTYTDEIILTSGTTWDVPTDWNDAHNSIECWGAGAAGTALSSLNTSGGGGGAWSGSLDVALTPDDTLDIQVGTSADDTYLDGANLAASTVGAEGGSEPLPEVSTTIDDVGQGGLAANGIGDTKFSGGNGGWGGSNRGAGGGGAAGPDGDGGYGGGAGSPAFPAGGGGANGGAVGGDGVSENGAGGAGNNGGGDGGVGSSVTASSLGADGDSEARSGGGGGGTRNNSVPGGTGGGVGGGGGGNGATSDNSVPGAGLIRIRYTPAA